MHDWYTDREWLTHRLITILKWVYVLSVLHRSLSESGRDSE